MSITRNTMYNVAGAAASIVVALVTIPPYLHQIGDARYGVLALVWLLLGYFGLFDLGLSRATANYIARLRDGTAADREGVFWTAILLNTGLGLIGALVLYFAGGPALWQWLKMSPGVHAEAVASLPWIAAAVPVATSTAVMTGVLTGQERFGAVNLVQVGGMVLFQTVPLVIAYAVGPQLNIIIPAAVLSRCVVIVPLFLVVKKLLPLSGRPHIHRNKMQELLGYGAWVSVTNVVGPILSTFDRFVIGALVSASAVAYYDVPFRLVSKAQIVPGALSQALFPRLSAQSKAEASRTARESVAAINAFMTPVAVVGILLIHPFLSLWVGVGFASKAAPVGVALLLGIWINSGAVIPFAKLQAEGRPDLVAKIHVAEVLPYLVGLWWAVQYFGFVGAAYMWSIRVGADAVLLFWFGQLGDRMLGSLIPSAALLGLAWVLVSIPLPFYLVIPVGVALVVASISWGFVCSPLLRSKAHSLWAQSYKLVGHVWPARHRVRIMASGRRFFDRRR